MIPRFQNPQVDTKYTGVRPPADPAAARRWPPPEDLGEAKLWWDCEHARRKVLAASLNFTLLYNDLSPAGRRAEIEKTHADINDALDVWQAADQRYQSYRQGDER